LGGVEHILVLSNSRIVEPVLDGAEPIVSVQGLGGLSEGWRVGVLEIPKFVSGFLLINATIVDVVGGNLCKVLKGGEVGLALGARGFMVFKHEPQQ
jgi:hypothetical protein